MLPNLVRPFMERIPAFITSLAFVHQLRKFSSRFSKVTFLFVFFFSRVAINLRKFREQSDRVLFSTWSLATSNVTEKYNRQLIDSFIIIVSIARIFRGGCVWVVKAKNI